MKLIFLLLLLSVGARAQTPPAATPCAEADARRAMAESQAAAAEVKSEAKALRVEDLERENARLKGQSDSNGQTLAAEQEKSTRLAAANRESLLVTNGLQKTIAEQQAQIALLTATRDRLQSKIAELQREILSANHRRLCLWLHVGCIKEK